MSTHWPQSLIPLLSILTDLTNKHAKIPSKQLDSQHEILVEIMFFLNISKIHTSPTQVFRTLTQFTPIFPKATKNRVFYNYFSINQQ